MIINDKKWIIWLISFSFMIILTTKFFYQLSHKLESIYFLKNNNVPVNEIAYSEKLIPKNSNTNGFISSLKKSENLELGEENKKLEEIVKSYEDRILEDPQNLKLILAIAEVYYALNKYDKSIEYYKKALNLDPTNSKIKTDLALSYLNDRQVEKSKKLFNEIMVVDPHNSVVLGGLGRISTLEHDYEAAEEFFAASLKIEPNNDSTLFYLAQLKIQQKRYQEALDILTKLQDKNPKAGWIRLALNEAKFGPILEEGRKLEQKGNFKGALDYYKEQLKKDPKNNELYIALSKFYSRNHDFEKAIDILKEGLKINPNSNELLLNLGFTYLEKGDLQSSKFIFEFVNNNGDGNSDAIAGLGYIEELKENFLEAENLYFLSSESNPLNVLPLSYLANLRFKQKRYDEAIEFLAKIYELDKANTWTLQLIEEAKIDPVLDEINQLTKNRNYTRARQLYTQLLLSYPHYIPNYLGLGQLYIKQNLIHEAVETYFLGLKINPNSTLLYEALGNAYFLDKQYNKSRELFEYILKEDPENKNALLGMARLYEVEGNIENAEKIYFQILKAFPDDITALSYLSDLKIKQKNYLEAEKIYQHILKIDPKAIWTKQSLLRAKYGDLFDEIQKLQLLNKNTEAIEKAKNLLELAPESEDTYYILGQLYQNEKNYSNAASLYRKALRIYPDSLDFFIRLGITYLEMGEIEKAEKILREVNKSDPNNADALSGLGKIAALNNDTITASRYYEEALKKDSNNMLALTYYSEFLMEQKEYAKAVQIYKKILQINPKAVWAFESLQNAKYAPLLLEIQDKEKTRNYREAEHLYFKLIEQAPEQANYYIKLGQLYKKTKQIDKAISIYEKGLEIQPKSLDLQIALVFAYFEKGSIEQGKRLLDHVLKKDPKNPEALSALGLYYQLLGNKEEAHFWFENALKENPNNISALILLAKLFVEEKRYEKAEEIYKKLYALLPESWVLLAIEDAKYGSLIDQISFLEKEKKYEEAEILWKQLLAISPNVSDYYLRYGFFLQRLLQYDKAIAIFSHGIEIEPQSSELYAALGLSYLSLKKWDKAYQNFKLSLKLDSQNPDALAGLGYVDFINGDLERAEFFIKKALEIDPNRIAALSAYGELLIKQKRYIEAVKVYEKLKSLKPKEKWITLSLDDAKNGQVLERIKDLITEENYSEAADLYSQILFQSPDNPRYAWGLGQMYMRLKEYEKAIETFLIGLEKNPEENELRISLGYAYLFNENLEEARETLEKAIQIDNKNPEALAGLGRINALENNHCEAETLYRRALSIEPKNQSALTFLADLFMKQKRYLEAQELFTILWEILPDAVWVQRAWQDAKDGPITDIANKYAEKDEFELAAALYCQLIESSPDDPSRYLPLGQMYVNLQLYNKGIEYFYRGIEIDPEAWYLWRAMAFAYLMKEDFCTAKSIFLTLLENDPNDAESWAGLGRIEALNGSVCKAHEYYETALELAPNNLTTLAFIEELYKFENYYFSALEIDDEMIYTVEQKNEISGDCGLPKWLKRAYNDTLNMTCPTLALLGTYHEEDQWDPTLHRWSAEYLVYGGSALLNYPINNELSIWGRFDDQIFELKDLLIHKNLYSFDVQRFYLGAKWVYSPCLYIDAVAGITNYSPFHKSTFKMFTGTIAEPTLTFTYHTPIEKATIGFSSKSDLVARDFDNNTAKMVGYYFIEGTYERKLFTRTWAGIIGDIYWYNDFVHNQSERVLGWIQWRPPCFSDNFLFRYHLKYQTFSKNIPDYYTYKPQFVNQLQVTFEKSWRVCWADYFYTSLSYGHGWQNTRTKFAQIIVVNPVPTEDLPFVWDNRQYNILFGNLLYKYGPLQVTLNADYYRDTEKYTMWTVFGEMRWRL